MTRRLKDFPVLLPFSQAVSALLDKPLQVITPTGKLHNVAIRISRVADGCTVLITNGITHYLTEEALSMIKSDTNGNGLVLNSQE